MNYHKTFFTTTGIHMLSLLVPILVSCLSDSPKDRFQENSMTKPCKGWTRLDLCILHSSAPWCRMLPELRTCLEKALKAQTSVKPVANPNVNSKAQSQQPAKPSIKLKTDFSNFTGWNAWWIICVKVHLYRANAQANIFFHLCRHLVWIASVIFRQSVWKKRSFLRSPSAKEPKLWIIHK